ncbi:MAG: ribonuclease III [Pseudomonadales bacterium]|jgi:ribonuclease-3|nr:ribonuclease III [Pseudomonadales bacterium]MDG1442108.1 ribonuclease III [Pseudomonadales bacterium]
MEKLQRSLGYTFANQDWLVQAVTHRSHGKRNNERLEFLGDSILSFVIADALYQRFTDANEGQLSRLRASLVKQQTLAEIARELELGNALIMGTGELKSGGFQRDSVLSDALEAIIGAIYLDASIEIAQERILHWFFDRLENMTTEQSHKDAKTKLQEFLQARQEPLPNYEIVKVSGPSHDQIFVVSCEVKCLVQSIEGIGNSRRIAEQNAAMSALKQLGIEHEH